MSKYFEEWRPVAGCEGLYEVSSTGRVRSLDRIDSSGKHRKGKLLKPSLGQAGHFRVNLGKSGGVRTVHRLVLEAFVGPCPEGMVACHGNDLAEDNRLENLRWGTKRANALDATRNGISLVSKTPQGGGTYRDATHCVNGHEFTKENTGLRSRPGGGRYCRQCARDRRVRRYESIQNRLKC